LGAGAVGIGEHRRQGLASPPKPGWGSERKGGSANGGTRTQDKEFGRAVILMHVIGDDQSQNLGWLLFDGQNTASLNAIPAIHAIYRSEPVRSSIERTCPSAGNRNGTGSAAAFGAAKPAIRKRRLAGTDGREIGAAIDLSSPGPDENADRESKAVKLPGNGPRPLFFSGMPNKSVRRSEVLQ